VAVEPVAEEEPVVEEIVIEEEVIEEVVKDIDKRFPKEFRGVYSYVPFEPGVTEVTVAYRSPMLAEGSIPSDPDSTDASSLRISPKVFSVRMTSNCAG